MGQKDVSKESSDCTFSNNFKYKFVIKANEDNIDKRLLPFIMMSEGFTQNSIRNSCISKSIY